MLEALESQLSNLSRFISLRLVCKDINNYIDRQDAACFGRNHLVARVTITITEQ
jgi:hypothetical protein